MAREKPPKKDTSGEVPAWFMTYSDVITLLMTFFILLLTFASQEPESFDRMKVSMFGGGGSAGIAGSKDDAMDRESIVMRHRPDSSRLTQRGSETPPTNVDPSTEGASLGLKSLDKPNELGQSQRVTFHATRNSIFDNNGELTSNGITRVNMFATQLKLHRLSLSIQVSEPSDLPGGIAMAESMHTKHGVKLGQVSIGQNAAPNMVEFSLTRQK